MKVIFFNSCRNWGGGEKWHYEMAQGILKRGFNVSAMAYPKSKLFIEFSSLKLAVNKVKISSTSFLNPIIFFKIYKLIKKQNANCIILNLPADVKVAGIAAKLAGVKTIIYRRGSAIPISNSFSNRFLFKRIITNVLVNSNETAKTVLANNKHLFPSSNIKKIYNGISIEYFEMLNYKPVYIKENNEIVIGNLARLSKQKGQFYFINIAKRLKEEGVRFKILIGGDGELEKELKRKVNEAKLNNEILFLGFIDNSKDFMSSIDIFVFPSIWEGFGFSLVEAKLMKKPIVAFNISSNPEVVRNNIDGFLVEPFNEEELHNSIICLAKDKDKRVRMGEEGYKDVLLRFNKEKTIDRLINYLYDLK